MKNKIIILLLIILTLQAVCAQKDNSIKRRDTLDTNIKTTVITLDLSRPNENSVKHSNKKNKLIVNSKNPLAFNLINGNPYKYKYVLNFTKVNLFTNETFNPTTDDIIKFQDNQTQQDKDGDSLTNEVVISLQSDLKKRFEKLKTDIEKFISDISSDDKLNMDEFNLMRSNYKTLYLKYSKELLEIEEKITLLDNPDDSTVKNNSDNLQTLSESIRLLVEKLVATSGNAYLLPIDINGDNIDFIEIQLDRYEKDNQSPETYKYKIWIKGGLKIDVSGGVYITSLFDDRFYTRDFENSKKVILKEDNGNYDFGFGTMVNLSLRGGSWVRPTLNFGAIFTSNQKFQILSGIGLILGKNQRFILHGGISMGRVSVLRDGFVADGETQYDLGADGSIPTNEKFDFGHFFGITYNFNKPKSKND